jgi:hypothetical protein
MMSHLPMPVHTWHTESAGHDVAIRISVDIDEAFQIDGTQFGFVLKPDQARQIIRDLSAAVLASDVKRKRDAIANVVARRQGLDCVDARTHAKTDNEPL